jgi:transposase
LEQHPGGYLYTQFCEYYRRWLKRRRLSMRQIHRAGEKLFVDYAGKRPQIVAPVTGEVTAVSRVRRHFPVSECRTIGPSP